METIRLSYYITLSAPPEVYYQGESITYACKVVPQEYTTLLGLYLICTDRGRYYVKDILLQVQS